ncbi:COG4223 family protein [Yoonia litorea]|uniref:COG4223 family protein n=1 Tax=Yoonia litorea TaxID=1123755 RepID=UPI001041D43A|nr:hypothetical protein [Yoonia litorea]
MSDPHVDAIPPEVHASNSDPAPDEAPAVEEPTLAPSVPPVQNERPVDAAPKSTTPPPKTGMSSFLPLALGGLFAGAIGYAVATLTTPTSDDGVAVTLSQQGAAIEALEAQLDTQPNFDTSEIEEAMNARLDDLSASIADIAARIEDLESRPAAVPSGDPEASAAVTAEMDALRAQIADMTNAAQAELDEARAAAAAIEENAAAAARNAAARAALARIQTAMESGAPIGAALADLEEVLDEPVPDALLAVEDGVVTLPALQDSFSEVAREALATARSEGVAGEATTGFGAFLRNQFDVRSTAPRDGDDADAVLSRAEAALRSGRLSDALAELSALPEVARAEMSDWLAQAEARASAVAAVDVLSSNLSDN